LKSVMTKCPVCAGVTALERVRCVDCGTAVEGRFSLGWVGRLSPEQSAFARVFLECRGKIKDVEEALGLSYPTVVARLDELVQAVRSESPPTPPPPRSTRREILDQLASGEIDVNEAARRLKERP
jgi:hypothetical protein